jgi:hypothetical protein
VVAAVPTNAEPSNANPSGKNNCWNRWRWSSDDWTQRSPARQDALGERQDHPAAGLPLLTNVAEERAPWWCWLLLIAILPLIPVFLVIALVVWLVAALVLLPAIWVAWCARGRYALIVYSNSPTWQQYFERQIVPAVGERGVALNWSEEKRWRYSLAVAAFRFFGRDREFNPLAVVFRPFAWPRMFRFYGPFKAFKHGRPEEVERMRRELLAILDDLAPRAGGSSNVA